MFAHFFGDKAPPCKADKNCDVCVNLKGVQKAIEDYRRQSDRRQMSSGAGDFNVLDLYGGGRRQQQK